MNDIDNLHTPSTRLLKTLNQFECIISAHSHDDPAAADNLKKLASFINHCIETNAKFQLFFSLHHGNFPSIEYLARIFHSKGYVTIAIYFFSAPPERTFDKIGTCSGSFKVLNEFLKSISPASLYVQAHAKWCFLGIFIKYSNPGIQVYQEVYDWMNFFIDRTIPKENFSEFVEPHLVPAILDVEDVIRNDLDGYIYKDGGPHMEELLNFSNSPAVKYIPCPPLCWQKKPKTVKKDNLWRMVYAGQLKSKSDSCSFFGDIQLHNIIRQLTSQHISVTAYGGYSPCDESFTESHRDYLVIQEENEYFQLKKHLSVKNLIRQIHNRYHFGLLIYYFEPTLLVGKKHLESALPSKLLTYLSAGLPVIISEELKYAATIVSEHEIGVVVKRDQINNLSSLLSWHRYEQLIKNVKNAQKVFTTEAFFENISLLLESKKTKNCSFPK